MIDTFPVGPVRRAGSAAWAIATQLKENIMAWKTPKIAEISVGMEINCYACAEL